MITSLDTVDTLIADLKADRTLTGAQKEVIAGALGLWLPTRKDDFTAAAKKD